VDILLIHQAFTALDEPGGTRHHEFARHLQELGHHVTILTGQGSYLTGERTTEQRELQRSADDEGVEIWRIPGYHAWHRSFFHRLLSFFSFMVRSFLAGLKVDKVDLVWGTSPPIFQAVSAALLARWRHSPFLLEVRDLWPYFAVATGVLRSQALIHLSNWLERWLYRAADVVVVNSPGFIEHVRARGAKRVSLVPNGVDCKAFSQVESVSNLREQLGIHDGFLVLYAGAHGLSNDLWTLLRAARDLKAEPHIHFVLAGAGKEKANLMEQAKAWNLERVHFIEPVPKRQIPGLLTQADAGLAILMAIDAYKTTFPNKVFDYMAAGIPVLCAIDGVIRGVVEEGQAGLFVEPGDPSALAAAVLAMAADRAKAQSMGESGRRWVCAHYDRKKLASELAMIMEEALQQNTIAGRVDAES
jgi:glycosyltransferase involved in cell wall biosynthesis